MVTEQIITCINCPVGCRMNVQMDEAGEVVSVSGNTCARGAKYARQECTQPLRMITAVIPCAGSPTPLSVKTAEPVPKKLIGEVMKQLKTVRISAPVEMGQIVLRDVCGTGINMIATRPLGAANAAV